MDILSPTIDFNTLSLLDLLHARDQFHPHLMHKANVVGTRHADGKDSSNSEAAPALANSEVRFHSWPCILVLMSRWAKPQDFGPRSEYGLADYIPKRVYMGDGRVVPICVVEAASDEEAVPPTPPVKPAAAEGRGRSGGKTISGPGVVFATEVAVRDILFSRE